MGGLGLMVVLCLALALVVRATGVGGLRAGEERAAANPEIAAPPLDNGVGTLEVIQEAPTVVPFQIQETEQPQPQTVPPLITMEPQFALEPTVEPEPVSITLTAVGDCTLGGDVKAVGYKRFREAVDKNGYEFFFKNVRDIFAEDDLTIINLEGPLTASTEMRPNRPFNFKGDPDYIKILEGNSIEVCNVANNHSQDFGTAGLLETADLLEKAGMGVSGYHVIDYEEVRGVTVGFVGLTEWEYKVADVTRIVSEARETCDLLIVSMHWGIESSYTETDLQKTLGHACVDAGADLVIGNHSHRVGGIEQYKGKYICYSLGNFCFGGHGNPDDKDAMIFRQRFDITADGEVQDGGIDVIPCSISSAKNSNNFQPTPLEGDGYTRVLKKVSKNSNIDQATLVTLESR